MEVVLKQFMDDGGFRLFPIAQDRFLIGRAEDCHLRPPHDDVGQYHCAISIETPYVVIRDAGSGRATLVNDEQIRTPLELASGDIVRVGPLAYEVLISR